MQAHSLSAREVEELKNLRSRVQTKEGNSPAGGSKVTQRLKWIRFNPCSRMCNWLTYFGV